MCHNHRFIDFYFFYRVLREMEVGGKADRNGGDVAYYATKFP